MTDHSSLNLPIDQALTSDMMLGLKPAAPRSRSYRISQAPINGSAFNPGSMIILELPTGRRGTWLDQSQSYLKFTVQCTSTAAVNSTTGTGIYLDNSAYSFIQRVDIYNQSNLLESINEYGQLANFLIDTSLTQSDKAGLSTIMGFNNNTVNMNLQASYTQYNSSTVVCIPGDRSGQSLLSVINTAGISTAIPYVYTLPFLSGVVGVNASKMLPIGKLSNPIHIEIYLAANDDAIYYGLAGNGTVWQITNVEFIACYVEMTDDIPSDPGMPEYISSHTYRQANTYLPAATAGEFTTLLPFRCASLNAVYARFRNQATAVQGANATAAYRKGSSINPNFGSYYFRIGSGIYPNKPVYLINSSYVGTGAEGYAELLKSFHALSTNIGNSAIQNVQYNVCAGNGGAGLQGWSVPFVPNSKSVGTADTHNNAFAIGLELQTFSNRNDIILSGISTLNAQLFFTAIIYTGCTAGGTNNYNYTCDFFANMDMILIIQDGIMSAKF